MKLPLYPADAIAKMLNLTPRRVRQTGGRGVLPRAERGRYDLLCCIRAYVMFLQRRAEGRGVEPSGMNEERLRLLRAQAEQKEWEASELQRSLLPRAGVLDAWRQLRVAFSAICLAIPPKLSARLAAIQDPGGSASRPHRRRSPGPPEVFRIRFAGRRASRRSKR